ncbi:MAG TPA: ATP synthase subunit I [Acidimicrobiales bacterium]|nr:ATP synthase subunit I [Acidimicrobiales bacterium]
MTPPRLAPPPSAGPAVEREVVTDMIRRAWPVLPALVAVAGLIWGLDGAASAGFAIGLVLLNFLVAATLLAGAARIALALVVVAALGGFVARLVLITVAVLAVKDQPWVEMVPLGLTLIITHLGLLIWETRHLSLSLAYPTVRGVERPDTVKPSTAAKG